MSKSNSRKQYSKEHKRNSGTIFSTAIKAMMLMFFIGIVLLIVFALAISKTKSPIELTGILSFVALYLGVFLGSLLCSAAVDSPGSYIVALVSSIMFVAVLFIIKTIIPASDVNISIPKLIFFNTLIITSSLLGVVIAEKHHTKRKRRR